MGNAPVGLMAAAFFALGGCNETPPPPRDEQAAAIPELNAAPDPLNAVEAVKIADTARSISGKNSMVRVVCGASVGVMYFGSKEGWVASGIDGPFAITENPAGVADVIVSSGFSGFTSLKAEGAIVEIVKDADDELMVIVNDSGRVVETYLVKGKSVTAFSIRTAVKQEIGPVPARGGLYVASCDRYG